MDFSPQIHFCPVVKFCICHDLRPFASVYSLIIVDGCVCFGVRRKKFTSSVLKSCLLIAVYTQGMFSAILFANGKGWMLWFPALSLPTYLSIYLPIYLSIYLSIYLPIYLSFYPSIYLSINQSINLSICQRCF